MPDQQPHVVEATVPIPDLPSIVCIACGSILMIAFMAHHPEVDSSSMAAMVDELARKAPSSQLVHGALIALLILVFHGYMGFTGILGRDLGRARAGTLAYAVGSGCMIAAALTNGFVAPALASSYAGRPDAELETLGPLFHLCGEIGQVLAQTGTVALSTAIFAWSCVLLGRGGFARATGVLGGLVGVLPVIGLLSGVLHLHVHGMAAVIFAQAAWGMCVAVWMLRLRSKPPLR